MGNVNNDDLDEIHVKQLWEQLTCVNTLLKLMVAIPSSYELMLIVTGVVEIIILVTCSTGEMYRDWLAMHEIKLNQ